ncbi:MAG: hypothetical protein IJ644_02775 [Oscillospiraceae bacterium]|nr:hypothetical protein [Oscillospiraceae bacterium]
MRKFDAEYPLLKEMYSDDYYPDFLVDKIRDEIRKVIAFLETGITDTEQIQEKFDSMTIAVNELEEEFEAHDSELESIARDNIAVDVMQILNYFGIPLDAETALREREW